MLANKLRVGSVAGERDVTFSYDYNSYGADIGTIYLYAVDTSGNILETIKSYSPGSQSSTTWFTDTGSFTVPSGGCHLCIRHLKSSSSYRGDYAVANFTIDGVNYSITSDSAGFSTSTGVNTPFSTTAWDSKITVPTSTSGVLGRWLRDSGGTGSSNTGPTAAPTGTYYFYTEASSPNSTVNISYWLFSPLIT
jgi:hypothetical protein